MFILLKTCTIGTIVHGRSRYGRRAGSHLDLVSKKDFPENCHTHAWLVDILTLSLSRSAERLIGFFLGHLLQALIGYNNVHYSNKFKAAEVFELYIRSVFIQVQAFIIKLSSEAQLLPT